MTLLPRRLNSQLNGKSFAAKAAKYAECGSLEITKKIAADYTTWGQAEVEKHQAFLAGQALEVWPLTK